MRLRHTYENKVNQDGLCSKEKFSEDSKVYYNEEKLERLKKQNEEYWKQKEEEKGYKYTTEAGLQVVCTHCKHERFEEGKALLNTRGMTFFNLDWLNDEATILICKRCGYTHWFCKEVKKFKG